MSDLGFTIQLVVTAATILLVSALQAGQLPLDDLAARVRRLANFLWMSAGADLTLCSRLWLVQKALAVFRGLLEDLAPAFAVNDPVRFSQAVALLEEAERHLASAAAHRSRGDHAAAIASITKARHALEDGKSLLP